MATTLTTRRLHTQVRAGAVASTQLDGRRCGKSPRPAPQRRHSARPSPRHERMLEDSYAANFPATASKPSKAFRSSTVGGGSECRVPCCSCRYSPAAAINPAAPQAFA